MSRVKPGGWAEGEKLLAVQATQLDINVDALDTLTRVVGVRRHATYTDAAALRLAPVADGDIVYVSSLTFYQFFAGATLDDDGITFIRPTAIDPGDPGRWKAMSYDIRNIPSGVAGLDTFARLPAAMPKNGTIFRDAKRTTFGAWSRTAGTAGTLSPTVVTVPGCQNGDLLIARYDLACVQLELTGPDGVNGRFTASMNVNGGLFSNIGPDYRLTTHEDSNSQPVHVMACANLSGMPAGAGNTVTVRLDAGSTFGTISGLANTISYDVEVIRP